MTDQTESVSSEVDDGLIQRMTDILMLQRKEKALAEAAALLMLKKKVQSIWGDEDDDTSGRSGR